ncbi:DivIVA domain-containing protein [Lactobacillus sp. ESL0791]|uniref:DivIVA domain-containing protein n=1 Tax=Lactobacillus sp. ESL0791 TaxID=2983234 RepID=UPI0024758B55
MDIHNQEFKHRGINGYDRREVDSFLDRIVDDYGNALDETADLKNEVVELNNKVEQLEKKVAGYNNQKQSLAKMQEDAKKKAKQIVSNAHKQAAANTSYEKQQQDTIRNDYDRIKEEVAEFRNGIQKLLQNQIDVLSDDKWQHALDTYFHTDRFYPFDGSEPILLVNNDDDEVDIEDADDVDFGEEDMDDEPDIMTGDSPNHETVNLDHNSNNKDSDTTIVFPDDYKGHE